MDFDDTIPKKYSGMCIGGPQAGTHCVQDRSRFSVSEKIGIPSFHAADRHAHFTVRQWTYQYDEIITPYGKMGVWFPHNWTVYNAMCALFEDYAKYQDLQD